VVRLAIPSNVPLWAYPAAAIVAYGATRLVMGAEPPAQPGGEQADAPRSSGGALAADLWDSYWGGGGGASSQFPVGYPWAEPYQGAPQLPPIVAAPVTPTPLPTRPRGTYGVLRIWAGRHTTYRVNWTNKLVTGKSTGRLGAQSPYVAAPVSFRDGARRVTLVRALNGFHAGQYFNPSEPGVSLVRVS
jgi:hypothetical protein